MSKLYDTSGNLIFESSLPIRSAIIQWIHTFKKHLPNADFRGLNLSKVIFTRKNFSSANLEDATIVSNPSAFALINCDITNSNFTDCNLSECDFNSALVSGGNFTNANVEAADFTNADISVCNFTNTNTNNTVWTNANCTGTIL